MPDTNNGNNQPKEVLTDKTEIVKRINQQISLGDVEIRNVEFYRNDFSSNNRINFGGAIFGENVSFSNVDFKNEAYFLGAYFKYKISFSGAKFKSACFAEAKFNAGVSFKDAEFEHSANFNCAQFGRPQSNERVSFFQTKFKGEALFQEIIFFGKIHFERAVFYEEACFIEAEFKGNHGVSFDNAIFEKGVSFGDAKFDIEANFRKTKFFNKNEIPDFLRAKFKKIANFTGALFCGGAYFMESSFESDAIFRATQFEANANFVRTQFWGFANFNDTIFKSKVVFVGEKKRENENFAFSRTAETSFFNTYFSQPDRVLFKRVYLGKTSFLDTDISKVDFTDVEWADNKDVPWSKNNIINKFKQSISCGRRIIYDEVKVFEKKKDYVLVEKIYQQLKVNFEAKGRYPEAGYFHWGEMEMRRMQQGKWLRRNLLCFAPWYKYFSGYGERPKYAFLWLLLIVFALPSFYILSGMKTASGNSNFNYVFTGSLTALLNPELWGDYWEAILYGMQNLTLSRNPSFSPIGWGRAVAIFQKVAGIIQAALFTLALKRKFKR